MAVPRRWREKKYVNQQINGFLKSSPFLGACALCSKNMIDPSWKGLKRFISDAQLHRTLSELAMHDLVTLAVYKEGKKNLIFVGWRGKKGRSWSLRTVFSWNSLGTLHLVSVSRTPFWPISLYGISFASHHHICGKMFPFTPHYNSVLEKLTIEIMLQTEKSHLSTWAYAAFSQVKPPLGLTVTCWCKE